MSVCTGVSVKTNAINIVLLHHGSWFPESGMHSASTVGRYGIYLVYGTLNCNVTVTGPKPNSGLWSATRPKHLCTPPLLIYRDMNGPIPKVCYVSLSITTNVPVSWLETVAKNTHEGIGIMGWITIDCERNRGNGTTFCLVRQQRHRRRQSIRCNWSIVTCAFTRQ